MKYLRAYIETMIEIDEEEWQSVTKLFTKKEYKKGDEIFSAGVICQKLYYVASGVTRIYNISSEGKDLTWMLNYNKDGYLLDPFCGDYVSYRTQMPGTFFAEALEDSIVYEAEHAALDKHYESGFKWMTLARWISDGQLILIAQRAQMMARLTAKEKYLLFKEKFPIYEEVLPDYQFATVLGITPQSLSRIKREVCFS